MRRVAVLRDVVHPARPDLHLNKSIVLILDGDVQRLVTVRLRIGNPVPESLGVGLVFLCHIRIYLPAEVLLGLVVGIAINDETDCEDVEHSFERNLLFLHLLVDGVSGLRTDFQLIFYSCI